MKTSGPVRHINTTRFPLSSHTLSVSRREIPRLFFLPIAMCCFFCVEKYFKSCGATKYLAGAKIGKKVYFYAWSVSEIVAKNRRRYWANRMATCKLRDLLHNLNPVQAEMGMMSYDELLEFLERTNSGRELMQFVEYGHVEEPAGQTPRCGEEVLLRECPEHGGRLFLSWLLDR